MAKVSLTSLLDDDDDTTDEQSDTTTSETVTVTKDEVEGGTQRTKPPRDPDRIVKSLATVYTPSTVFTALRKYASGQRAKGQLVSYGVIVLLAVDKHQDELAALWTTDQPPQTDGGLFGVTVRKAAPKKVPWQLHGATPDQIRKLDDLVDEWNAPNRSVLVEEALVRYLDVKVNDR